MNPVIKTILSSLIAATLLGLLALLNTQAVVLADAVALFFTLGLSGWTIAQYRRGPRLSRAACVIPFPARAVAVAAESRYAA